MYRPESYIVEGVAHKNVRALQVNCGGTSPLLCTPTRQNSCIRYETFWFL